MNYYSLRLPELKQICRDRNIKGYSKLRKRDIIKLIQDNEQKIICNCCEKEINEEKYVKLNNESYVHLCCFNKIHGINTKEEETCSICLENINIIDEFKTECGHYFHKNCINQWDHSGRARNQCPNCRQQMKKTIPYCQIHNEIVRRSEELERTNSFNPLVYQDFDNLFFQMIYISLLYKKKTYNNIQTVVDSFNNDINIMVNDLFHSGAL